MSALPGWRFLCDLEAIHKLSKIESTKLLREYQGEVECIGLCLKALYEVSTCTKGCRGGDHLLEYLAGRAFNLGYSAFSLIRIGYYDESLNQVRSLGEIANLQSLFVRNSKWEDEWRHASPKERLKKFAPSKVRKLIENENAALLMDGSTYSMLCETATHVTPDTKPNLHSDDGRPRVGGSTQSKGVALALKHLSTFIFCTATVSLT
jgi:hypothetical protein